MVHEHEERYSGKDPAAWDRTWTERSPEEDLFSPGRRDIYNFIDETKMYYLRRHLPASGRAVEIGAGSGRLLIRAGLERPFQLVALDYAPSALRNVSENYERAGLTGALVLGDTRSLPFADGQFSVLLSGGLLEHFHETEAVAVVREQLRIIRPGGLWYADVVPRKTSLLLWNSRREINEHASYADPSIYWSDFGKSKWKTILRTAGVQRLKIFSAGVMPPNHVKGYEHWTWRLRPLIRALDGTPIADWIGFYYFCVGWKAE